MAAEVIPAMLFKKLGGGEREGRYRKERRKCMHAESRGAASIAQMHAGGQPDGTFSYYTF